MALEEGELDGAEGQRPGRPRRREARGFAAGPAAAAAVLIALATALHAPVMIDHDVAYFVATGGRLADGRALYTDLIEFNTAAAPWLGWLSVSFARAAGTPPDLTHKALMLALAGAAGLLTVGMMRRLRPALAPAAWIALAIGLPAVLMLGTGDLGRREHLLVAGILPCTVAVVLAGGGYPPAAGVALRLAAGALAGAALFLKPHFLAFGLVLGALDLLRSRGRPGRCLLETWTAGLVAAAFYAGFVAAHPVWLTEIVPFSLDTYGRYASDIATVAPRLLTGRFLATVAALLLAAVLLLPPPRQDRALAVWTIATALAMLAVGLAVALWQGLGFRYHRLPVDLFAVLAAVVLAAAAIDRLSRRPAAAGAALALALAAAGSLGLSAIEEARANGLRARWLDHPLVAALAPSRPGDPILVISPSVVVTSLTLPFIEARWAGSSLSHFPIPGLIEEAGLSGILDPAPPEVVAAREAWFRDRILRAFVASPPVRVGVDVSERKVFFARPGFDLLAWLRRDPRFDAAWRAAGLRPVGAPIAYRALLIQIYAAESEK